MPGMEGWSFEFNSIRIVVYEYRFSDAVKAWMRVVDELELEPAADGSTLVRITHYPIIAEPPVIGRRHGTRSLIASSGICGFVWNEHCCDRDTGHADAHRCACGNFYVRNAP